MANISFGERTRRARIRHAMSQAELADKVGVSQALISHWELSKIVPNASQKAKLREILGTGSSDTKEASKSDAPEPSAVGSWLNRSRIERALSVPQLADKAGISAAAIYGIEQGRILNPRSETVRKLERALKVEIPHEAKEEVREEATVEGVGELIDFDPHDDQQRPSAPGIYVLYDISERPIYVGQAIDIKRRIHDHSDKFWFKAPIVETGSYILVDDGELRKKIEAILIRFLKSNAVINKQHVDR